MQLLPVLVPHFLSTVMPNLNTPRMNHSPMRPPYFLPIGGGHKVPVDPQTNHTAKSDINCQCFDMVLSYHFCLVLVTNLLILYQSCFQSAISYPYKAFFFSYINNTELG
jgi:hypothetical protein